MKRKKNRKKSISQLALESLRKPVPPPGQAHEMAKDYRRRPKHRKPLEDPSDSI